MTLQIYVFLAGNKNTDVNGSRELHCRPLCHADHAKFLGEPVTSALWISSCKSSSPSRSHMLLLIKTMLRAVLRVKELQLSATTDTFARLFAQPLGIVSPQPPRVGRSTARRHEYAVTKEGVLDGGGLARMQHTLQRVSQRACVTHPKTHHPLTPVVAHLACPAFLIFSEVCLCQFLSFIRATHLRCK